MVLNLELFLTPLGGRLYFWCHRWSSYCWQEGREAAKHLIVHSKGSSDPRCPHGQGWKTLPAAFVSTGIHLGMRASVYLEESSVLEEANQHCLIASPYFPVQPTENCSCSKAYSESQFCFLPSLGQYAVAGETT